MQDPRATIANVRQSIIDSQAHVTNHGDSVNDLCDELETKLTGDPSDWQLTDWEQIKKELEDLKKAVNDTIQLVCDEIEAGQAE